MTPRRSLRPVQGDRPGIHVAWLIAAVVLLAALVAALVAHVAGMAFWL